MLLSNYLKGSKNWDIRIVFRFYGGGHQLPIPTSSNKKCHIVPFSPKQHKQDFRNFTQETLASIEPCSVVIDDARLFLASESTSGKITQQSQLQCIKTSSLTRRTVSNPVRFKGAKPLRTCRNSKKLDKNKPLWMFQMNRSLNSFHDPILVATLLPDRYCKITLTRRLSGEEWAKLKAARRQLKRYTDLKTLSSG